MSCVLGGSNVVLTLLSIGVYGGFDHAITVSRLAAGRYTRPDEDRALTKSN